MQDPYKVLGVARTASADEIKSAYRKLAKQLHPDLNPGAPDVARRFQEVTDAYELLSDPARRAAHDRGEREGQSGMGGFRARGMGEDAGFHFRRSGPQPEGDDLFEHIFGMFNQRTRRNGRADAGDHAFEAAKPESVRISAEVPFLGERRHAARAPAIGPRHRHARTGRHRIRHAAAPAAPRPHRPEWGGWRRHRHGCGGGTPAVPPRGQRHPGGTAGGPAPGRAGRPRDRAHPAR